MAVFHQALNAVGTQLRAHGMDCGVGDGGGDGGDDVGGDGDGGGAGGDGGGGGDDDGGAERAWAQVELAYSTLRPPRLLVRALEAEVDADEAALRRAGRRWGHGEDGGGDGGGGDGDEEEDEDIDVALSSVHQLVVRQQRALLQRRVDTLAARARAAGYDHQLREVVRAAELLLLQQQGQQQQGQQQQGQQQQEPCLELAVFLANVELCSLRARRSSFLSSLSSLSSHLVHLDQVDHVVHPDLTAHDALTARRRLDSLRRRLSRRHAALSALSRRNARAVRSLVPAARWASRRAALAGPGAPAALAPAAAALAAEVAAGAGRLSPRLLLLPSTVVPPVARPGHDGAGLRRAVGATLLARELGVRLLLAAEVVAVDTAIDDAGGEDEEARRRRGREAALLAPLPGLRREGRSLALGSRRALASCRAALDAWRELPARGLLAPAAPAVPALEICRGGLGFQRWLERQEEAGTEAGAGWR
ncbi:unnamed protein product [Lampetra fluviatilis]